MFFEIEVSLSERFPGMTPISIRRERASEVFLLVRRLNSKTAKELANAGKKKVIRRKAGDDWF